jgi:hypothetical protein
MPHRTLHAPRKSLNESAVGTQETTLSDAPEQQGIPERQQFFLFIHSTSRYHFYDLSFRFAQAQSQSPLALR